MFKARALFGVNIRADVFSFLVLHGKANPSFIARQLGYSQRRVQDALSDLTTAGVFKAKNTGKANEYFADSDSVLRFLGASESEVVWFDWRALCRAVLTSWRQVLTMKEAGLTPYILDSEREKVLRRIRNDLLSVAPPRKSVKQADQAFPQRKSDLMGQLHEVLKTPTHYEWKRYWIPNESTIAFPDRGFPLAPQSDALLSSLYPTDHVEFEAMAPIPCLVLLGEPGMGKSVELKKQVQSLKSSLAESGAQLLNLNLKSYGSEERLIRELFECETFRGWSRGEYALHVFLDSLDEGLLHRSTIANVLLDQINRLPSVDGLYLRIACRAAEWPRSLEQGLKVKWGQDQCRVYNLVPLTRADVIEAAEANDINAEEFLRAVESREAVPLAFKPITLRLLLESFRGTGNFPASQTKLYEAGCRVLCEESNTSRIDAKLTGQLSPAQRMEVASHIAAATIFCNRNTIWTGPSEKLSSETDLTLDDLCQGTLGEDRTPITSDAVRETLSTALFASRGPQRLGWAHQTYAEFLAAWYLQHKGMSTKQTMRLLVHPGDPQVKLVPQLHETAAWLAGMNRDVFREVMRTDPEVLLRSDADAMSQEDMETLVNELLSQFDADETSVRNWTSRDRYWKLNHSRLTDQLRPFILDHSKSILARQEAILMAKACHLTSLAADLALVALDDTEKNAVRIGAASAVVELGEATLKGRLKPLLQLPRDKDPDD
jgi:hypothetical protein